MRDRNPSNKQNWKVVCSVCGAEFDDAETIDLADGHAQQMHPELVNPHFNVLWVGLGPKPTKKPKSHGPRRRR